jgi:hypothetical protein
MSAVRWKAKSDIVRRVKSRLLHACFVRSTPTAATIITRPKPAAKSRQAFHTQAGRALAQLGIEHIAAYSPEARGRSERMFRTLQDRLPKELALGGITGDVNAANRFIREVYLPSHNARFAGTPPEAGSAFVPVDEAQWRDILCVQEERIVAPDTTVAWNGRRLRARQGARP